MAVTPVPWPKSAMPMHDQDLQSSDRLCRAHTTGDDRLGESPLIRCKDNPCQFKTGCHREPFILHISPHPSAKMPLIGGIRTLITIPAVTCRPCPARLRIKKRDRIGVHFQSQVPIRTGQPMMRFDHPIGAEGIGDGRETTPLSIACWSCLSGTTFNRDSPALFTQVMAIWRTQRWLRRSMTA